MKTQREKKPPPTSRAPTKAKGNHSDWIGFGAGYRVLLPHRHKRR